MKKAMLLGMVLVGVLTLGVITVNTIDEPENEVKVTELSDEELVQMYLESDEDEFSDYQVGDTIELRSSDLMEEDWVSYTTFNENEITALGGFDRGYAMTKLGLN